MGPHLKNSGSMPVNSGTLYLFLFVMNMFACVSLEMFCSTGLQLLGQLVESKHWLAALKVLSNTVTTFITDADALLEERK